MVAASDVVALVFNFGPLPVLPRNASPSIWRKLRGNGYLYEAHELCFISAACRMHALIPSASPSDTPQQRLSQLRTFLLCHTSPSSYSLHASHVSACDDRPRDAPSSRCRHLSRCRHHPGNTFAPHTPHDTSPMPSSRMVYCASACDQIPNVTAIMKRAFVYACECARACMCAAHRCRTLVHTSGRFGLS